jgi:hypothetical protein
MNKDVTESGKGKGKGKFHSKTGHGGPNEKRYNSILSLTSTLDGVGGQRRAQTALPPRERDPVPILYEAGWTSGPVWTGAENNASTGIRSPDCPARSESLYRPRYNRKWSWLN